MTRQLVLELKEAGQDFEFYPTTDEMLAEAYKALESVCGYHKSVLDIGCGTCNFKRYIERKGGSVEYFGIEKSDILIGKLPYDVFVLGTDIKLLSVK